MVDFALRTLYGDIYTDVVFGCIVFQQMEGMVSFGSVVKNEGSVMNETHTLLLCYLNFYLFIFGQNWNFL